MPIPKRKELFLPILRELLDENEHTSEDIHDRLMPAFKLTKAERRKRMTNGIRVTVNRVSWAFVDLGRQRLIVKIRKIQGKREQRRATVYRITARGTRIAEAEA